MKCLFVQLDRRTLFFFTDGHVLPRPLMQSWYGVHSPPFRDMLLARCTRDILTQVVRPHVARLWLMANGTLVMGMTVTLVFTCLAQTMISFAWSSLPPIYGTKAFFSNRFHMKTLQH